VIGSSIECVNSVGRLPYNALLLRAHGTLRDVATEKSVEQPSDVHSKENILSLSWA
jgi:hypothetical protein